MIVYSEKIVRFVEEVKCAIREILLSEIGLKVHGERFYNREETASYPINVVVFDHKNLLGYFNSDFYEMGFHQSLMHAGKKQLHDIIRHELAHYLVFLEYGACIQPHGKEFIAFCRQIGWNEEVYRATCCIENDAEAIDEQDSSILRKVKKLMALATSSNAHEAEQAMIKSRQLLLKHNIDSKYIEADDEEKIILKRILKQKRENAKMRSIAFILQTFFVNTVYTRGGGYIYLEILGTAVNVEIAEYVAGVLEVELERLWNLAQHQADLRGTVAKNSFFLGVARGYCDKVKALKREYGKDIVHALMVIENQLVSAKDMVYKRLSTRKASGYHCAESSAYGEMLGRQLSINPAIDRSSKDSEALLLEF